MRSGVPYVCAIQNAVSFPRKYINIEEYLPMIPIILKTSNTSKAIIPILRVGILGAFGYLGHFMLKERECVSLNCPYLNFKHSFSQYGLFLKQKQE